MDDAKCGCSQYIQIKWRRYISVFNVQCDGIGWIPFRHEAKIHLTQFTISVLIQFPKITANIIHLIASMLSFRIAENWVWNFAKRMKDFYCHRTEINVCFGYRFRNAIQPRLNMLYSMLIKRYTEWPEETQSAFHQINLCFFFHLKLAIDSVSWVMHIY